MERTLQMDEYMRQRRNLMLLATLLLFIEVVGVEVGSVSLLGINFKDFSHPEYIKRCLFVVFVIVLFGYMQRLYHEGWNLVVAAYQKSVDKCIDEIVREQIEDMPNFRMKRKADNLFNEDHPRPTLDGFLQNPKTLQKTIHSVISGPIAKESLTSVRSVTKREVFCIRTKSRLITLFMRPEGYTHLWPFVYAWGVMILYIKALWSPVF